MQLPAISGPSLLIPVSLMSYAHIFAHNSHTSQHTRSSVVKGKMIHLFLSDAKWNGELDSNASDEMASFLKNVEDVLKSLVACCVRSESRLWLCNTISHLTSVTPHHSRDLFIHLLKYTKSKGIVAAQLWRIILERRPQKAGHVIAKRSLVLAKFFHRNPRRILHWFDNFASIGESEHKKGAKALSQFSFINRDICWDELEWKGKHGQSPAVVATKPHYFLHLDILRTVENFIDDVPDFWSSYELAESLKDGEIFSVDMEFFVDYFVLSMYDGMADDIWGIISEFLLEEQFSLLCQHLLILLQDEELHAFIGGLGSLFLDSKCKANVNHTSWIEVLLSEWNYCTHVEDLLLINAVINQRRLLTRLIRDEENEEKRGLIEKVLLENRHVLSDVSHQVFLRECLRMKKLLAVKFYGLLSWIFYYFLLRECKTSMSWETVFAANGISFRKTNDYALISRDRFSNGIDSDVGIGALIGSKRDKKYKTKKRRKKCFYDNEDEMVDIDASNGCQNFDKNGSWLLSTDGYSCLWNSADLPEHLSGHFFLVWLRWLCFK